MGFWVSVDWILESDGYLRWQAFVGYKYPTYGWLKFIALHYSNQSYDQQH